MATKSIPMMMLSEMVDGQEADVFVLLTAKEPGTTRDGKPYYRVGFQDAGRDVVAMIWNDSALFPDCRDAWQPGMFFKIRARYQDTQYGPQVEINRIREVSDADQADGFDPQMCMPQSRFDPDEMMAELLDIVQQQVRDRPLRRLVTEMLTEYREPFMSFPAACRNHHAYSSGLLEHTLSVTRTCVYLADKYEDYYPDLQPPLNKDVLIAGGVLHDIGKLREYDLKPQGAEYNAPGRLVGHVLQGRDMLRECPAATDVDPETLLRLEHVIISHQRLPEWGAPKPPMTPEALLVHFADDIDAKFQMMYSTLRDDAGDGPFTSAKNLLRQYVFRGES